MDETIITLENLTQDRVYIVKNTSGQLWRKSYENTNRGRAELQEELDNKYIRVILNEWGTKATLQDNPIE